ncbi:uncharacterized protein LOC144577823 [Callithrix jacchus]
MPGAGGGSAPGPARPGNPGAGGWEHRRGRARRSAALGRPPGGVPHARGAVIGPGKRGGRRVAGGRAAGLLGTGLVRRRWRRPEQITTDALPPGCARQRKPRPHTAPLVWAPPPSAAFAPSGPARPAGARPSAPTPPTPAAPRPGPPIPPLQAPRAPSRAPAGGAVHVGGEGSAALLCGAGVPGFRGGRAGSGPAEPKSHPRPARTRRGRGAVGPGCPWPGGARAPSPGHVPPGPTRGRLLPLRPRERAQRGGAAAWPGAQRGGRRSRKRTGAAAVAARRGAGFLLPPRRGRALRDRPVGLPEARGPTRVGMEVTDSCSAGSPPPPASGRLVMPPWLRPKTLLGVGETLDTGPTGVAANRTLNGEVPRRAGTGWSGGPPRGVATPGPTQSWDPASGSHCVI